MNDPRKKEILTLQVGRYANHVGAHFWNFQDELILLGNRDGVVDTYHHNILHRAPAQEGADWTPRLIAFDTRDALGSLNTANALAGSKGGSKATPEAARSSWKGEVSLFQQPHIEKNALHAYLDAEDAGDKDEDEDMLEARGHRRVISHPFGLDESVKTWPDFLKSRLHPKALQELPFRDQSNDFGLYTAGDGSAGCGGPGAISEEDREHHHDALRHQLEECDSPQGTQTLVDLEGGWGGLAASLAIELQDECRNRPRVCHALLRRENASCAPGCRKSIASSKAASEKARAAVNLALALHGLGESCTLTCILDEEACVEASPHMAIDPSKPYHTSAILAAALDVATSPLRFSDTSLDEWASPSGPEAGLLGAGSLFGGRRASPAGPEMNMATISAWLPLPLPDASVDSLRTMLRSPSLAQHGLVSLGPVERRMNPMSGIRTRRLKSSEGKSARLSQLYSRSMVARGFAAPRMDQASMLEKVLADYGVGAGSAYAVSTPLPIPITYPLIFRESLGSRGEELYAPRASWPSTSSNCMCGEDDGEMRVMCDEISGVASVERSSSMGAFLGQVCTGLDVRNKAVMMELERNGLHRDDAYEVLEDLETMAERYGYVIPDNDG